MAFTQVMNGASDQFFARAGFAIDQDSRVCSCDCLNFLQDTLQGGAVTNNLFEVVFSPNLLFEVKLFFFELVFERINLTKRQRVLYCDRDLRTYLVEQLGVIFSKRMLT